MTSLHVPRGDLARLAAALHRVVDRLDELESIEVPNPERLLPGASSGVKLANRCTSTFDIQRDLVRRRLRWLADDIAEADARFQEADVRAEDELRRAGERRTIPMPGLPLT
ncbi:hypothetical protein [Arachnia propionica]|uniref:Uncharacterized protein n=1 Tax=Arachnia propionica TaxID=1750 RepID=A0A3P1WR50_9ACTN|nr:hypothetical protein [Arachnia propionica]RRD48247.1 hypothetical protein EII35_13645 [Arachnia propionica]